MKKVFSLSFGFTLIELVVVIAILGVLAAVLVGIINPLKRTNQANDARVKNDIHLISNAMAAFYLSTNSSGSPYYPASVAALVPSQLNTEPKDPVTNASYTTVITPGGCLGTAASPCTDVAVYGTLRDAPSGTVWCWRSSTNAVQSYAASSSCTAP